MSVVTPVGFEDSRRSLVRRTVAGGAVVIGLGSAALVVALVLFAQHTSTVLRLYFAGVGLFLGLQAIGNFATFVYGLREPGPARPRRPPRNQPPNWPAELFEMEDRITLGKVSAFDYQSRLRPLIRELAVQRLAAHWHLDLSRQPAAARARLGEELWGEVQAADDDGVDRRDVPGPSTAQIRVLVDRLESI